MTLIHRMAAHVALCLLIALPTRAPNRSSMRKPRGRQCRCRALTLDSAAVAIFLHIRVVMAIVIGLGITRLLNGLARFVQHPKDERVYLVHLGWVFTLLLTLVHFWWWEFGLTEVIHWTFEIYIFVVIYAILLFLLCAILFPDTLKDYANYEDYFISRRRWFFGIFAATIVIDVIDTLLKGASHFALLEPEYLFRIPVYLTLCAIAIWTPDRRFHTIFVLGGLAYEASWIVRLFNTLN